VNTKRTAADDADVMFQFPVGIAVSNAGDIVYVGDADAGKVYKLFRKGAEALLCANAMVLVPCVRCWCIVHAVVHACVGC
jgi:hypothetical protein